MDTSDTCASTRAGMPEETPPSQLLTILRVAVGYISHLLGNALFVLCVLPLALLMTPFPRLKHRCLHSLVRAYLTFYTRVYLPALGIYEIAEVSGLEKLGNRGPVVYASNHRGRLDALLLLGILKHTGVVIKAKYTIAPALATLVTHFDFVSTDPSLLSSLAGTLKKCRSLIAHGTSLLVFPEGSRAASGRLKPFRDFAFKLAIECETPVVPVIVHSTIPLLTRAPGSLFPRGHNVCRIRFLEPELIRLGDTPIALSDRVRRRMAAELRELDRGTVWETHTSERT